MLLRLQPGSGLFVATLGAMAVLAGVVTVTLLLALVTEIVLPAQERGTALFDVLHGPPLRGQQALSNWVRY
jgi:hypothetical protein